MNLEGALRAADRQFTMLSDIAETTRMKASVRAYIERQGDLEQLGELCQQYGADRVHNYIDEIIGVN